MGTPATLPLSDIVNVTVNISPQAPAQPTFNIGLIVGSSAVIPSYGSNSRVRTYSSGTWSQQMLTDGFTINSPEYIAAQLYFSQSPSPQSVCIGRRDSTAINTVTLGAGGSGYVVGDLLFPTQGGSSNGVLRVSAVSSGVVTAVTILVQGTGYSVASGLATTTDGAGTGCTINITVIGENHVQALIACRSANSSWYGCMSTNANANSHQSMVAWAQTAAPSVFYFGGTSDTAVLNADPGNICELLKQASYEHAMMIYSSLQPDTNSPPVNQNPHAPYVAAAVLGAAMGLNSGLAGSFFTLKFKTIVGIVPEPLTEAQKANIEGNNCNVVLDYGNAYNFLEQGVMPNGYFADLRFNVDMLVSNLQFGTMNVLVASPAVPQTDPGQALLLHASDQACDLGASVGFIAGGRWNGGTVRAANGAILVANQQTLPKGYRCISPAYSTQSSSDRAARKAMPIYIFLIYAGAAHFVVIQVNVQQ